MVTITSTPPSPRTGKSTVICSSVPSPRLKNNNYSLLTCAKTVATDAADCNSYKFIMVVNVSVSDSSKSLKFVCRHYYAAEFYCSLYITNDRNWQFHLLQHTSLQPSRSPARQFKPIKSPLSRCLCATNNKYHSHCHSLHVKSFNYRL